MQFMEVSLGSATTSDPIIVGDRASHPGYFGIGFGLVFSNTAIAKVQHTFDDPAGTPTWFDHPTVTGVSSNTDGNYSFPVRAIRLSVTAWTSGTVKLKVCVA